MTRHSRIHTSDHIGASGTATVAKSKVRGKGKRATSADGEEVTSKTDNGEDDEAAEEVIRTRVKKKARSRANSDDEVCFFSKVPLALEAAFISWAWLSTYL